MKKFAVLMVVLLMMIGCFTGCTKTPEKTEEEDNNVTEQDVLYDTVFANYIKSTQLGIDYYTGNMIYEGEEFTDKEITISDLNSAYRYTLIRGRFKSDFTLNSFSFDIVSSSKINVDITLIYFKSSGYENRQELLNERLSINNDRKTFAYSTEGIEINKAENTKTAYPCFWIQILLYDDMGNIISAPTGNNYNNEEDIKGQYFYIANIKVQGTKEA